MATLTTFPAELRNQIFELTVPHDEIVSFGPPPAICRTCRQLCRECLPLWISNTFKVERTVSPGEAQFSNDRMLCGPSDYQHIQRVHFSTLLEFPPYRDGVPVVVPGAGCKIKILIQIAGGEYTTRVERQGIMDDWPLEQPPMLTISRSVTSTRKAMIALMERVLQRQLIRVTYPNLGSDKLE